jgi:hypothetical protein
LTATFSAEYGENSADTVAVNGWDVSNGETMVVDRETEPDSAG